MDNRRSSQRDFEALSTVDVSNPTVTLAAASYFDLAGRQMVQRAMEQNLYSNMLSWQQQSMQRMPHFDSAFYGIGLVGQLHMPYIPTASHDYMQPFLMYQGLRTYHDLQMLSQLQNISTVQLLHQQHLSMQGGTASGLPFPLHPSCQGVLPQISQTSAHAPQVHSTLPPSIGGKKPSNKSPEPTAVTDVDHESMKRAQNRFSAQNSRLREMKKKRCMLDSIKAFNLKVEALESYSRKLQQGLLILQEHNALLDKGVWIMMSGKKLDEEARTEEICAAAKCVACMEQLAAIDIESCMQGGDDFVKEGGRDRSLLHQEVFGNGNYTSSGGVCMKNTTTRTSSETGGAPRTSIANRDHGHWIPAESSGEVDTAADVDALD